MCGGDLTSPGLDARGRVLFFSTPFVFLLVGIMVAVDLGLDNPVEAGATIGLSFLSMVYLVLGGSAWILCRSFGIPFRPTMPWRAGVFGTFQLIACVLLALPLQEYLMPGGMPSLTFHDEERLKLGLIFAVFLPLGLLGLSLLIGRDQASVGPNAAELSSWGRRWRALSRFGAVPVFLGTLLGSVALVLGLPVHQREFLFARVAADFQLVGTALANLDRALAEQPEYAPALHLRGLLRVAGPDRERAGDGLRDLQEAVRLAPTQARYRLGLAIGLDQLGRTKEALDTASAAVDLKPFDPALWVALADLRLKAQDRPGAVAAYREALRRDPDDARTLNNLAYTLLELNQDLGTALELARASVARLPNHVFNLDTLAWALYKNGQVGEAYQVMLEIREAVATPSAEIEFHHAVISHALGLLGEPRKTFEALWERPDVQGDPMLRQEITQYIASLGVAIRRIEDDAASRPTALGSPAERPPVIGPASAALDGSAEEAVPAPAADPASAGAPMTPEGGQEELLGAGPSGGKDGGP
jgi:tetratricopeptide (TPR) repeat protein